MVQPFSLFLDSSSTPFSYNLNGRPQEHFNEYVRAMRNRQVHETMPAFESLKNKIDTRYFTSNEHLNSLFRKQLTSLALNYAQSFGDVHVRLCLCKFAFSLDPDCKAEILYILAGVVPSSSVQESEKFALTQRAIANTLSVDPALFIYMFDPQEEKTRFVYLLVEFLLELDGGRETRWQLFHKLFELSFNPQVPLQASLDFCTKACSLLNENEYGKMIDIILHTAWNLKMQWIAYRGSYSYSRASQEGIAFKLRITSFCELIQKHIQNSPQKENIQSEISQILQDL